MNKLPAFTLLEITVSMLLSSIIILIGWSVFSLVSQSYILNQDKSQRQSQWIILNQALRLDMEKASAIYSENEAILMDNDSSQVEYKKEGSFFLRRVGDMQADTLFTGLLTIVSREVKNDPYKRIDELTLTFRTDSTKETKENFVKTYSSEELMKKPAHAND